MQFVCLFLNLFYNYIMQVSASSSDYNLSPRNATQRAAHVETALWADCFWSVKCGLICGSLQIQETLGDCVRGRTFRHCPKTGTDGQIEDRDGGLVHSVEHRICDQ